MRKLLLAIPFLALLTVVGCSQPQTYGGIPRKKNYRAIVSLSPSTTELGLTFGINLIGRSKADNYPPSVKTLPVYADLKPDYEGLTRVHPDLIIFDRDLYNSSEVDKLKATGADVLAFGADSLDDYEKELYRVANKVGGESSVAEYIEKIHKQRQSSEGDPFAKPVKAAMIIADPSGHHMIAGAKSFQADIVKIMGATPVGPESNKFEELNPEFLVSQNPDVLIFAGDSKGFIGDSRFANLKAVKDGKYFSLSQDISLRRGGRVDTFIYEGHKSLALILKGKN